MMRRTAHRTNGFTLLEALLAIGVFAAGMTMVVQLMRGTSRIALRGNLETQAALRCDSMIEEYLAFRNQASTTSISERWSNAQWRASIQLSKAEYPGMLCISASCEAIAAQDMSRVEVTRLIPAGNQTGFDLAVASQEGS